MAGTYESIVRLNGDEAEKAIVLLKDQGEVAALEYLRRWHEPGEGTLVSSRDDPWSDGDSIYESGQFVMYYNLRKPYIGLVQRVVLEG